jgi:methylated-DNA-[protein]-cysteine S-methyltransferase
MGGKVTLSSSKIGSLWVTVAYTDGPVLLANSIPTEDREESIATTVKSLKGRGITSFEESNTETGADLARKILLCSDSVSLSFEGMPEFTRTVLDCVRKIPAGSVATYKEIAVVAGRPRAYRAVGNIMATHPFPYLIPCHRVIRSDRSLGGYGPNPETKAKFLAQEGVDFVNGRARVRHPRAQGK